jgi:hypothetical protein
MERFSDPDLFRNDLIADYFQSITPPGYAAVYFLAAQLGIGAIELHKLLPIVLGIVTTSACFLLVLRLLPVPLAAFLAALALTQMLWLFPIASAGTPRAFAIPSILLFLYFLARRSLAGCLVTLALTGLIYPPTVLVLGGILVLRLVDWHWPPRVVSEPVERRVCVLGLAVVLVVGAALQVQSSSFGPTITRAEARTRPEFNPRGRVEFFLTDSRRFWVGQSRSGLLPGELASRDVDFPPTFALLLLPLVLVLPRVFPATRLVSRATVVLPQLLLASVGLYITAHLLLFRLHLPSRYTQPSLRVLLAVVGGIVLVLVLDALLHWSGRLQGRVGRGLQAIAAVPLVLVVYWAVVYPTLSERTFPETAYVVEKHPQLYEYLAQLPKDAVIGSLTEEADNVPAFSRRTVLVGRAFGLPYHTGYYRLYVERVNALLRAQYSPSLDAFRALAADYSVDFMLLDRGALSRESLDGLGWVKPFPATAEMLAALDDGSTPALAASVDRCAVFQREKLVVVDVACVLNAA